MKNSVGPVISLNEIKLKNGKVGHVTARMVIKRKLHLSHKECL